MKEISIHGGHEDVIIIAMSLLDIYNPKEGYTSMEYSWFKGTQADCQKTSSYSQNQHHTAEAKSSPMQRH